MSAAERDQSDLQHLLRVKENIDQQAKKDIERLTKMVIKNAKREKRCIENKEFTI